MLGRHDAREAAFKALFALNANPDADRETVNVDALPAGVETPSYMTELVDGVLAHQAELDAAITTRLKAGWRIDRLTKPDLITLRLGLYEIQYEPIPDKVAIDEAIELAKKYSDDKAAKFVNGILAHFVKPDQQ